ncbi:MAG: 23S rRNA (uracil(1939)-C(5))-methyltransferase RlmD [Bacteroidetes bacterium]|nr:23S rRNA (uracil(1939)-C(5))-methyltransferase RlmD [Bacteroidota bacterium]
MNVEKKNKKITLEKVEIIDAGSEGKAVGRANDRVVFVPFVVPGDVVDVKVTKKRASYYEGVAQDIHHYSDKRTEPRCEHFGICGGCKWQNMHYDHQLFYKQKQVEDNLRRIGKLDLPEINPILASDSVFYYRNKLEYTFSNKRWITEFSRELDFDDLNMNGLGFHIPGMYDRVLDIDNCYLQTDPSNDIRLAVKNYADEKGLEYYDVKNWTGFLRNLIIRTTSIGELMVILIVRFEDSEAIKGMLDMLAEKFPAITSLMYVINDKKNDVINDLKVNLYKGNPFIMEEMEGLKFKIGPVSFYQTNSSQAYALYKVAREFAGLEGHELVYDLYTGTGTIANFVAARASKVVGVEYVPAAIEDAYENSKINNITNTVFYAGDLAKVLDEAFVKQNGRPDVVITDPPRAGMHEKVVRHILEMAPDKIVYVSCNPATQARDVAILAEQYTIEAVQPVDMFPHTQHVENVMKLVRKHMQT